MILGLLYAVLLGSSMNMLVAVLLSLNQRSKRVPSWGELHSPLTPIVSCYYTYDVC